MNQMATTATTTAPTAMPMKNAANALKYRYS
jgi:hypothetical protein